MFTRRAKVPVRNCQSLQPFRPSSFLKALYFGSSGSFKVINVDD